MIDLQGVAGNPKRIDLKSKMVDRKIRVEAVLQNLWMKEMVRDPEPEA